MGGSGTVQDDVSGGWGEISQSVGSVFRPFGVCQQLLDLTHSQSRSCGASRGSAKVRDSRHKPWAVAVGCKCKCRGTISQGQTDGNQCVPCRMDRPCPVLSTGRERATVHSVVWTHLGSDGPWGMGAGDAEADRQGLT